MAENAWRIGCPVWIFALGVEEGARLLLARLWGSACAVEEVDAVG